MSKSVTPLERLRHAAGLSRPRVAEALGVSERHVYRFERGVTSLRRPYAKVMAELYEVSVEAVMDAAGGETRGVEAA